ncbi:MAG: hypothetical protein EOQ86_21350 [Mesorhizobium sp.]|uniref:hypothetical protein n=1 Tax=Mesorhizobium sp. TaxID=1871066 RepID=UPI000FE7DAC4|nr:hypothetical protein [Mesorhizobium sp.]RWH76408.1 MAG: hypothetical protein EOQ85_20800 [Mesorhizobium sp.]RWH80078.1 MAG: hypothetical protein EOQ86_21350 [Mesorhizobium sp.]RWH89234.1 MAG: hypothetical protein EOQ87_18285 [Mesorhizobium sp.]RWI01939.1 MAG: hypothetical protein EOQ88_06010 [Mesorhizobium sp.]RWI03300.1 MAG: hypothetical protein EOQ89_11790 [Mesorhizobium sp.]
MANDDQNWVWLNRHSWRPDMKIREQIVDDFEKLFLLKYLPNRVSLSWERLHEYQREARRLVLRRLFLAMLLSSILILILILFSKTPSAVREQFGIEQNQIYFTTVGAILCLCLLYSNIFVTPTLIVGVVGLLLMSIFAALPFLSAAIMMLGILLLYLVAKWRANPSH